MARSVRLLVQMAASLMVLEGVIYSPLARAEPLIIYVSPSGSDDADGSSQKQAIATLNRAQQLVTADASGYDEVKVLFMPGIYNGMSVVWKTFPGIWVRFMPAQAKNEVVFDGRGARKSGFFKGVLPPPKKGESPVAMKLEFRDLTIRNYCEGISLQSWDEVSRMAGGFKNKIINNKFEYIGSKYDPVKRNKKPKGACTAAVRLLGVAQNRIEGNAFRHIINLPTRETQARRYGPAHLHAIYIAHLSHENTIAKNSFDDFSGDPIRIRDKSNKNRIVDNVFGSASAGAAPGAVHAMSQWYCNKGAKACVETYKNRKECASTELLMQNNRIEGGNVEQYADRSQGPATCED